MSLRLQKVHFCSLIQEIINVNNHVSMKYAKCKLKRKCLAAFSFDLLYLFSYSSAIVSILPCQARYKLAFQSQTPRAESPEQTFLWKFVLKQLGKSEQNRFCTQSSWSHSFSHLPCGWVYPQEQPQWFQWSHIHAELQTQAEHQGFVATRSRLESSTLPTGTEGTTLLMFLFLHFFQKVMSRPKHMG